MDTESRQSSDHLVADLLENPQQYNFYTAANLLERYLSRLQSESDFTENYCLRFSADTLLKFPESDVSSVIANLDTGAKYCINSPVLNLAGAFGPLPYTDTEQLLAYAREKNSSLNDFLDIFNHRLMQFLYENRKKQVFYYDLRPIEDNQLSQLLYAFSGMRYPNAKKLMPLPPQTHLYLTSLLIQRHCTSHNLRFFLETLFGVPVEVHQFSGAWWGMEVEDITLIGESGQNQILGENVVLGEQVWDQTSIVKLQLGPLTWEQFMGDLPIGNTFDRLKQSILFYTRTNYTCVLLLVVAESQVKPMHLGQQTYLGWTTWLNANNPLDYQNQIVIDL